MQKLKYQFIILLSPFFNVQLVRQLIKNLKHNIKIMVNYVVNIFNLVCETIMYSSL